MKTKEIIFGLAMIIALSTPALAQNGEELFKGNCGFCHTVGKGMLTGPDLLGATKRHPDKWLRKWIKSSSTMIQDGDEKAVALFDKYNQISMPDVDLNDEQILSIIDFLKQHDNPAVTAVASAKTTGSENSEKKAGVDKSQTTTTEPAVDLPVSASNEQIATASSNTGNVKGDNNNTALYIATGVIGFLFIVIFILGNVIKTLSSELSAKYRRINIQK